MREHYTPKNKHLTLKERQLIEAWINEEKVIVASLRCGYNIFFRQGIKR